MAKKTLAQLQEQIQKLQREAENLKAKEVADVIARIREAIEHYGITADELYGHHVSRRGRGRRAAGAAKTARGNAAAKTGAKTASARKRSIPIKYRDEAGNTWTGRGSKPRWLAAALADGRKIEDFLLQS
jgi:DNA-binding protein H-NS